MSKDYNLPKTKKEKIELLNAIARGEMTIDNLKDHGFSITMWREDDQDPAFMQTFDGKQRLSKVDFEANKISSTAMNITLELNQVGY